MNPGSDDNKRAQIGFESQDEKEKLISLTSSAALTSLIGGCTDEAVPEVGLPVHGRQRGACRVSSAGVRNGGRRMSVLDDDPEPS